jgi:hypothetical protein
MRALLHLHRRATQARIATIVPPGLRRPRQRMGGVSFLALALLLVAWLASDNIRLGRIALHRIVNQVAD